MVLQNQSYGNITTTIIKVYAARVHMRLTCNMCHTLVSVTHHAGVSDEESDVQQDLELVQRSSNLTYIASGMGNSNHSDFFFGDGDMDQMVFESEHFPSIQNCQVRALWSTTHVGRNT